jgi:hypothetical protein
MAGQRRIPACPGLWRLASDSRAASLSDGSRHAHRLALIASTFTSSAHPRRTHREQVVEPVRDDRREPDRSRAATPMSLRIRAAWQGSEMRYSWSASRTDNPCLQPNVLPRRRFRVAAPSGFVIATRSQHRQSATCRRAAPARVMLQPVIFSSSSTLQGFRQTAAGCLTTGHAEWTIVTA